MGDCRRTVYEHVRSGPGPFAPEQRLLEAQRYVDANAPLVEAEAIEEERAARRMVTTHPPEVVGAHPR